MRLARLIQKGGLEELATMTHATLATHPEDAKPSVALVAPVIVANPQNQFDHEAFEERAGLIQANGVPEDWAEGFATLCTMQCPANYWPERWQQLVDDGGCFLDRWGHQAAKLGWQALDVFGVNPLAPELRYDGMGLIPLLQGRPVIAITDSTARIDCGRGINQTYQRMPRSEAICLWELTP